MEHFSFLERFGSIPGLERVEALLSDWGDPQGEMKAVLVGGTNGKGSVTAMLSSILQAQGFRTGSYYSPHLLRFSERLSVDGKGMGPGEIEGYERRVREWVDSGHAITYFEAVTAMAYDWFAKEGAEFAVMEVGMGGRLDATNVAEEALSIVTNVSIEHSRWLGDTVDKIAFEKAGIMKSGPAVTGAGNGLEVIRREARKRSVPLSAYGEDFECFPLSVNPGGCVFGYSGKGSYESLSTKLVGAHQVANAGLAVCGAELLGCPEDAIRKGLAGARIRGRMEVLRTKPLVVADVAHNPAAVEALVEAVRLFGKKDATVVFGCMKDKDWKRMLGLLSGVAQRFILTKPKTERAEEPDVLAEEAAKYCAAEAAESPAEAMRLALSKTPKDGMVVATGTFYMMEEVYEAVPQE